MIVTAERSTDTLGEFRPGATMYFPLEEDSRDSFEEARCLLRAATFALRAERWKDATGHLSDVRAKIAHEDYRKIVEMGTPAVPLILADLRVNGGWWFAALEELTGQNPATDEERRKPRTMREAWLRWGAAAGYIID